MKVAAEKSLTLSAMEVLKQRLQEHNNDSVVPKEFVFTPQRKLCYLSIKRTKHEYYGTTLYCFWRLAVFEKEGCEKLIGETTYYNVLMITI